MKYGNLTVSPLPKSADPSGKVLIKICQGKKRKIIMEKKIKEKDNGETFAIHII